MIVFASRWVLGWLFVAEMHRLKFEMFIVLVYLLWEGGGMCETILWDLAQGVGS